MKFSKYLKITPSATVAINSLAMQKKQQGVRVYNLSAGEPMLDTPEAIKEAAFKAISENKTHYPPVAGLSKLREEAAKWLNHNYGSDYKSENVLVATGGKMGLYLLLQALIEPLDEVLILSPYWVSYPSLVELFLGVPKIVETKEENKWKASVDDLKKNCSNKTKFLILNNGCNPTGMLYSENELKGILVFAKEYNLVVISDEVYSGLVYDDNHFVSASRFSEYKNNLVIIQSCSKNFAMTGWRVGFVYGPEDLIKILTTLTSQSTTGVATISQYAALAGLENSDKIMPSIKEEIEKRRNIFVENFNKLFNAAIEKPACGLYSFVSLNALGVKENDSVEFCRGVLANANVAVVPGAAFGVEGYVRFSFGEQAEELVASLVQLAKYLKL